MKVTIDAVVVRNKLTNEIIEVIPVADMYCNVQVTYPKDLIDEESIVKSHEGILSRDSLEKWYLKHFRATGRLSIESEAKDAMSIGNVSVKMEQKEVDW